MSEQPFYPEPLPVSQEVEQFIYGEFSNAEKYDNRDLLDKSGIYSLHRLAARIYAMGYRDGHLVGSANEREARRHQATRTPAPASSGASSSQEDRDE
jgi:hypothetical protein